MSYYKYLFVISTISLIFANVNINSLQNVAQKTRVPFSEINTSLTLDRSSLKDYSLGDNRISKSNSSLLTSRNENFSLVPDQYQTNARSSRENHNSHSNPVDDSTIRISNDFQGTAARDILTNGIGPQVASAENGDLYCLVSYDASGDGGLDMVLFKSTDDGDTWAQEVYVYNTGGGDLVDADIEVQNDY